MRPKRRAPYSANDATWTERRSGKALRRPIDHRPPHVRDRARVVHSAGFRRLQAKTQVLGIGEGDFHRTRLTHSMEVAQIARGIVLELNLTTPNHSPWKPWLPGANLIETIALAHDIGHPPFGHGGEVALNCAMRSSGGFEGNGQTLRLLTKLEAHTEGFGLDLTRRSLLGILKYPVPYDEVVRRALPAPPERPTVLRAKDWKPPKCYLSSESDVVEWILDPFTDGDRRHLRSLLRAPTSAEHGQSANHALDTGIMELADDIAYGVHDFEDAAALRLLTRREWTRAIRGVDGRWVATHLPGSLRSIGDDLFGSSSDARKRAIGAIVNALITSITITEHDGPDHPLLRLHPTLAPPARKLLDGLQAVVGDRVIRTPQVQTLEYRGQQLVMQLFEALASDPERLLTEHFAVAHRALTSDQDRARVISDFIAGMTDEYATRMYERLFVPRRGYSSDRL